MDLIALLKTIALCLISIVIEAVSATKEGREWFESLKRPKYSFSLKVWYVVGAAYYLVFGIVAYRLFTKNFSFLSTPILLLVLVMLVNGLSNFLVFQYKSVKWFYFIIYPFGVLLLALIVVVHPIDAFAAFLASLYFLWLIYDVYYGYHMWKLNGPSPTLPGGKGHQSHNGQLK